ncbi:MAG: ribonuclease HI family protein [Acidimicrobiia bacterium]|jgi:ribonuclease HI|nr:ribonuclease HI family protein [Acidimicrobiia bacterium]NNC40269.1 ribonuclease HI family protein [Acidimicrobiia bacterium]
MSRKFVIYTDGASRGNPGPSSIGAAVYFEGPDGLEEVATISEPIGHTTNNVAEYKAVVAALELVGVFEPTEVIVRADSQLLVRQLDGEYRVKSPNLKPLFAEVRQLVENLPTVEFEHVRRELNTRADALANEALDQL